MPGGAQACARRHGRARVCARVGRAAGEKLLVAVGGREPWGWEGCPGGSGASPALGPPRLQRPHPAGPQRRRPSVPVAPPAPVALVSPHFPSPGVLSPGVPHSHASSAPRPCTPCPPARWCRCHACATPGCAGAVPVPRRGRAGLCRGGGRLPARWGRVPVAASPALAAAAVSAAPGVWQGPPCAGAMGTPGGHPWAPGGDLRVRGMPEPTGCCRSPWVPREPIGTTRAPGGLMSLGPWGTRAPVGHHGENVGGRCGPREDTWSHRALSSPQGETGTLGGCGSPRGDKQAHRGRELAGDM